MLVRLIVFAVIAYFAFSLVRRTLLGTTTRSAPRQQPNPEVSQLVQDPNCGVYMDSAQAIQRKVPGGMLFFCSESCAQAHMKTRAEKAAP